MEHTITHNGLSVTVHANDDGLIMWCSDWMTLFELYMLGAVKKVSLNSFAYGHADYYLKS